jgi:hypothetical protein
LPGCNADPDTYANHSDANTVANTGDPDANTNTVANTGDPDANANTNTQADPDTKASANATSSAVS